MTTSIALLALLLAVASVCEPVKSETSHTYINNQSHRALRVTVTFNFPGESKFSNSLLKPLTYDSDDYTALMCAYFGTRDALKVEIWLDGASEEAYHGSFYLDCDRSVLAWDNTYDHTLGTGVDVFLGAYGDLYKPADAKFFTVFPNKPPCETFICT